jgi:hypothetical protein
LPPPPPTNVIDTEQQPVVELISQYLTAEQLRSFTEPGSGDGASSSSPGSTLSSKDTVQLLVQLPATYTASGDSLDAGLNQTLIVALGPSVKLHVSTQRLELRLDVPPPADGDTVCSQADQATPGNAADLINALATALGLPEASVSLACSVRAIDSADAGRRKLQVRGRTRHKAHAACDQKAQHPTLSVSFHHAQAASTSGCGAVGNAQLKVSISEPAKADAVAGSSRPISNVASLASQSVSQWQTAQAGTQACGINPVDTSLVTSLSVTLTMGLRDTSAAGGICAAVGSGATAILHALLPTDDASSVSGRMRAQRRFHYTKSVT